MRTSRNWIVAAGCVGLALATSSTVHPNVPDTNWHGFQLAKLEIGTDLRTDENIAIGPTIGVDLTEVVWRNPAGDAGDQEIADKHIIPFVYAGLQGRFDLGGIRERRGEAAWRASR